MHQNINVISKARKLLLLQVLQSYTIVSPDKDINVKVPYDKILTNKKCSNVWMSKKPFFLNL
jgi:hypothetical protein